MSWFNSLKVVYDVDGVLWDLNGRVFDLLGLDITKHVTYDIDINPYFTPTEKHQIAQKYADDTVFLNMDFLPGAAEIITLEDLGAELYIYSNCYSQNVADRKREQLAQLLPTLAAERIRMGLVSHSTNTKKLDEDIFALVDDSPYNVADSKAIVNVMPYAPYNIHADSDEIITRSGKILLNDNYVERLPALLKQQKPCAIRTSDLSQANEVIKDVINMARREIVDV